MLISDINNFTSKSTTSAVELSNESNKFLWSQASENIRGDTFQSRIENLNKATAFPQHNNRTNSTANDIGSCRTVQNHFNSVMQTTSIEQYRLQLYNYAINIERLRGPHYSAAAAMAAAAYANNNASIASNIYRNTYIPGGQLTLSIFPPEVLQSEEPKPQHSYIGLIAMAILNSLESKLVLSDIYQYILDNYPYFRSRGPGWRNSIRHNLSLNDCFIKSGRSANGKGHYWSIHPANVEDFRKGDFRRRKAQRKVRKHMGLSVDDSNADSTSPPPAELSSFSSRRNDVVNVFPNSLGYCFTPIAALEIQQQNVVAPPEGANSSNCRFLQESGTCNCYFNSNSNQSNSIKHEIQNKRQLQLQQICQQPLNNFRSEVSVIGDATTTAKMLADLYSHSRKRQFDVASLLAPENKSHNFANNTQMEPSSIRTEHTFITKVSVQHQQNVPILLQPISEKNVLNLSQTNIKLGEEQINLDEQDIDVVASDLDESNENELY